MQFFVETLIFFEIVFDVVNLSTELAQLCVAYFLVCQLAFRAYLFGLSHILRNRGARVCQLIILETYYFALKRIFSGALIERFLKIQAAF